MLLGAQQMGWTHALSHLRLAGGRVVGAAAGGVTGVDRAETGRRQLPQADQPCEQCLAFAQIDAVVAAAIRVVPADASPDAARSVPTPAGLLPATACVFRSRAPPAA